MSQEPQVLMVGPADGLIIAIVVLFTGLYLSRHIAALREFNIPPAVTGGLICSGIIAAIHGLAGIEVRFNLELRDLLLLVFFATIGLGSRLRTLRKGGKALALLVVIAGVFLIVQDITGVGLAMLMGAHPGYGLMAGSVSLAGGHGTAIAWGAEAEAAGLVNAGAIGVVFATFGLIAGGLIGGPVAQLLLKRSGVATPGAGAPGQAASAPDARAPAMASLFDILSAILLLAICVEAGHLVNRLLFARGVVLPGFLTAMVVGIVIINLIDGLRLQVNEDLIKRMGEVCLNLFLAMSLMSMQLWLLAGSVVPVMTVLLIQITVLTLFTMWVVFRLMGRDYDAVVISAGFAGLGLGATPVAIANMTAVTARYGASLKAFLVVPLVGAFFVDLMNAAVIKSFIEVISHWLT